VCVRRLYTGMRLWVLLREHVTNNPSGVSSNGLVTGCPSNNPSCSSGFLATAAAGVAIAGGGGSDVFTPLEVGEERKRFKEYAALGGGAYLQPVRPDARARVLNGRKAVERREG